MIQISEIARQLYDQILLEGFCSPEHTWEDFSILNKLRISNGQAGIWLRELEDVGLVKRLETNSIMQNTRFYVVPPAGFVSSKYPKPLDTLSVLELDRRQLEQARADWTKRGAIAAWVAIPLAIIGLILTYLAVS